MKAQTKYDELLQQFPPRPIKRDLKQKDLVPIFKTESIVSEILHEKRQLTTRHIQALAEFFDLSPAVFFPQP